MAARPAQMGHAMAAIAEGVRVDGFGVFLLIGYPGAFVDLDPDQLKGARPSKQARS